MKLKTRNLLLASGVLLATGSAFCAEEAQAPKDLYLKYRSALLKASKIDDLKPFLCKKVVAEIDQTPADMKPMMFGIMKETSPNTVQILSEDLKGDNATLTLTGIGEPAPKNVTITKEEIKGTVKLVKEAGAWKIDKESWEVKVEAK